MSGLSDVVGDLARDGYRIESTVDDTVIASKKASNASTHVVYAVITAVSFLLAFGFSVAIFGGHPSPIGFLVGLAFMVLPIVLIVLWIRAATRRVRFVITVDEDGEVVQERVR